MSDERSPLSPEDEIARRNCERFLARTEAFHAKEIIPFRADIKVAIHNVVRGVDAVLEHEDTIRSDLPKVEPKRLREIGDLAKAVEFAARQVERQVPPPKETRQLIARSYELRNILLIAAESLASVGIFPKQIVAKIRAGSGDFDAAGDCVELAALFTKHAAAVRGKTVVNAALVKEAVEVGSKLMDVLKPARANAQKKTPEQLQKARETRDRLWTLLVREHDLLRRVGAYLFGFKDLDKLVPTLQNAKRASAKKAASGSPEGAASVGNA